MTLLQRNVNRRLRMEGLEERQLMAGDVAVSMFGGELMINGDEAGNAVMVSKLNDGGFKISGLWTDGAYTTINGQSETTVNGVNGMHIDLDDGNDQLYINNTYSGNDLVVNGDLNIKTGGGDDQVRIINTTVTGKASIVTDQDSATGSPWWNDQPSGDDNVTLDGLIVYDDMDIKTGKGSDSVNFDSFFTNNYPQWNVVDQLSIDTGVGTNDGDTVDMDYVFAHESINVLTGNGDDHIHTKHANAVEGIYMSTYGGQDTVDVDYSDYMNWNGIGSAAHLSINTGSGSDNVTLDHVDVRGSVALTTGSGNDTVEMNDVHAHDAIYADLGAHSDTLKIRNSSAASAYLYGGSNWRGSDSIELTDNAFGSLDKDGWETTIGKFAIGTWEKTGR